MFKTSDEAGLHWVDEQVKESKTMANKALAQAITIHPTDWDSFSPERKQEAIGFELFKILIASDHNSIAIANTSIAFYHIKNTIIV